MLIRKDKQGVTGEWIDIHSLGLLRVDGTTSTTPTLSNFSSNNVYGRKIFHSVSYTDRLIKLSILVNEVSREEYLDKIKLVNALLADGFSMIMSNNSDVMYRDVHLAKAIEVDVINHTACLLNIELTAFDPFKYGLTDSEYIYDELGYSHYIENAGDYSTKPIITLQGSADVINISTGGRTTTYSNLAHGEVVEIDCESLSVTKLTPDGELTSALSNWSDNFIELSPGINEITLSGESQDDININIKFRDTFL